MTDSRILNISIASLDAIAAKHGFQKYLDMRDEEIPTWRREILTCIRGKFNGETIDIIYEDKDGTVISIDYGTQFKDQEPTFKFLSVSR